MESGRLARQFSGGEIVRQLELPVIIE